MVDQSSEACYSAGSLSIPGAANSYTATTPVLVGGVGYVVRYTCTSPMNFDGSVQDTVRYFACLWTGSSYSWSNSNTSYVGPVQTCISQSDLGFIIVWSSPRLFALRKQEIVSNKQSTKQDVARQAVQALLNMTPHLDKQTRKHRILLSLQGFFRSSSLPSLCNFPPPQLRKHSSNFSNN
jgi:hypothetical protein